MLFLSIRTSFTHLLCSSPFRLATRPSVCSQADGGSRPSGPSAHSKRKDCISACQRKFYLVFSTIRQPMTHVPTQHGIAEGVFCTPVARRRRALPGSRRSTSASFSARSGVRFEPLECPGIPIAASSDPRHVVMPPGRLTSTTPGLTEPVRWKSAKLSMCLSSECTHLLLIHPTTGSGSSLPLAPQGSNFPPGMAVRDTTCCPGRVGVR